MREVWGQTNLIILIAIQLLPLSTSSSKSRGAKGRKSCGRRQPSSQTTLMAAVVTLISSWSSIRWSLIFGHDSLSASGYTNASRYRHTMVFLRTTGLECERRERISGSRDIASEGVMICGRVMSGKDKEAILGDTISCSPVRWNMYRKQRRVIVANLFEHICCQHQDLRVRPEALHCSKIPHSFL